MIFTAMGYLIGALVFYWAARRRGLATEGVAYVAIAGLCGGVLGSRLAEWTVGQWAVALRFPGAFLNPYAGGRAILGGIVGGWIAVEMAKHHFGIRRSLGDLFALAIPAGEAVGRIGCFLNGDCYGTICALPWAVYQHGAWRHPAQFYSSAGAAATFVLLDRLWGRLPGEGDLFRLYLVLAGMSRFSVEFFRERTIGPGGLSLAQWGSLGVILLGMAGLVASGRRVRRELAQPGSLAAGVTDGG
jgi:phosphatidylglycerol:prolipoprotein diacylglycerol transferase